MEGIIYCYTSPSGKKYIGQTLDEHSRRWGFYAEHRNYCNGGKIDNARKKYGPKNFKYEVLERISEPTKKLLIDKLNLLEIFYIKKYDSYKNGYNSTPGGRNSYSKKRSDSQIGHIVTPETRKKISKKMKLRGPLKLTEKQEEKRKRKTIEFFSNPIVQYSLNGEFINEWPSATEAGKALGLCRTAISDCWNKKKKQCGGYQWFRKDNIPKIIPVIKIRLVLKFDKTQTLIGVYNSPVLAADSFFPKNKKERHNIGSSIASACRSEKEYKGFLFKYKIYGN